MTEPGTGPTTLDMVNDDAVLGWSIADHLAARRRGVSASRSVERVLDLLGSLDDPAVLIGQPLRQSALEAARQLDARSSDDLPLHGVPFLVKDNIDVAGAPTTCGCPSFSYIAEHDAEVVARLRRAGAIPVGKTNLDQFATGLVGTRSPFGTPRNPRHPVLIPGGSSSGSAVSVARGLVPFSLGTDTAGSGRVPAAMCGVVGLKPTVGRFPSRGIVPAVRRVDCPTVFARSVSDARLVARILDGDDPLDPFSRPAGVPAPAVRTIGVPADMSWMAEVMEPDALRAYEQAVMEASQHWPVVSVDITAFLAAGQLLYGGPLVAERTAAVGAFLSTDPPDLDPTVAGIIRGGAKFSAVEAYETEYRLAELRRVTAETWKTVDALLIPTIPGVATLTDVAADPVGANIRMGTFTTFMNLLDLAGVAIPVGTRADGLPSGVQLVGPAWADDALADAAQVLLGERLEAAAVRPGEQLIVVVGAHLSGMPLNHQLTGRGARLVSVTRTAPTYRLFALAGTVPPKPGLLRVEDDGHPIDVEVWALSVAGFGSFVGEIPPPLGVGSVELADGSWCKGFICEPVGFAGSTDVTGFGGWRAYRSAQEGGR